MIIYINGVKATKKAIALLVKHITEKGLTVKLATTKNGNLNIITNF